MQMTFCNLCTTPINPGSKSGGVMRTRDLSQILPIMTMGPNGPGPNMKVDKNPVPEVWDLCEECTKWIWDKVDERIKELRKKAELLNKESGKP